MRREPLPPAWRPAVARARWDARRPVRDPLGFPAWFLGSLLAHVILALALYFWPDPRKPQDALPPPTFDIVFEGGQPQQPEAEPAEGMPQEPQPPAPPSTADEPPPPDAPPQPGLPPPPPPSQQQAVPQPPAPPPPSPVPAPPLPTPPVQQALPLPPPPQPSPVPPMQQALPLPPPELPPMEPAPMPQMQGTVELYAPQTDIRLPDRLSESLPPPPPPPPPAPQQPQQQRPTPPAQQAQPPRPNLPGIWAPGGIQLGRPQTPPAGRPQARGLDLSVNPRLMEGQASRDPSVRVTGAQVGADWRAAFRRWLDQNVHYPQQAIVRGEDGQVRVRITASADGTVRNVQLVGPSTSPSLNFGTTYPFNGARLPTFPPGSDPNVVIDLTVNYVLIRGGR